MAKIEIGIPTDREIRLKLQERTTEELLGFQRKLRARNDQTPQAWTVRFRLVQELLGRYLAETWEG